MGADKIYEFSIPVSRNPLSFRLYNLFKTAPYAGGTFNL